MENKTLNNLKSLAKNSKTRNKILATGGIIAVGLTLAIVNSDSKNQRPADLTANVNIGKAPEVKSIPGTSESVRHNELVREENKRTAEDAIKKGESAIPRLTNPMEQNAANPFDLVKPTVEVKDKTNSVGEVKIPVPSVNNPPLAAPQEPPPPPAVKQERPVQQTAEQNQKKAEQEATMKAMIASALSAWAPSGQFMEFNHVGSGQSQSNQGNQQGAQNFGQNQLGIPGTTTNPAQTNQSSGGMQNVSMPPNPNGGNGGGAANSKVASVKAGTIWSAIVLTSVNSDEPGPVLAQIVSGPYSGARVMGSFSRAQNAEKITLQFNTISIQNAPSSYTITAFAVDPDTARTAIASNIDNHYFYRYGSLFASSFLSGYAQAISQSGATQTTSVGPEGVNSTTTYPKLNSKEKALVALGEFGSAVGGAVGENFSRPPTITLNSGVSFGLLFMSDASFN